jgi:hypothetical protein
VPVKGFFQQGAIFDDPAIDGRMIQLHPPFGHEFFDVERAERKGHIPTDTHENDLFGKMGDLLKPGQLSVGHVP